MLLSIDRRMVPAWVLQTLDISNLRTLCTCSARLGLRLALRDSLAQEKA